MRFFMIEWWDERSQQYQQEYYSRMESASERFVMLRDSIPSSDPAIETLFLNQE